MFAHRGTNNKFRLQGEFSIESIIFNQAADHPIEL